MRRIAILGYGLEGRSLYSYLKGSGKITILDRNENLKLPRGVKKVLGPRYLKNLSRFDVIYRSPGVPYYFSEIQKVKAKVASLSKLFFEVAHRKNATIVGITGSVGKTTTATLLFKMLKSAKKKVFLSGNIGINPLAHIKELNLRSIVVMELSSFQLEDLEASPRIAIVLDIYEEHLDKHNNFREYIAAKSNIVKYQKNSDIVFYTKDNKYSKKIAKLSRGKKIPISVEAGKKLDYRLKIPGEHNYKNVMAAAQAALYLGVSEKVIRETIESFRGIEHRIEFVRNLEGVRYYNNSKATNVASAIGALDAFWEKKIVLAGGQNKNLNLLPLVLRLAKGDVRHAIFFGSLGGELARISKKIGFTRFHSVARLRDTIKMAREEAKKGDIVLLSPGAASFDEFRNYEERGRKFKEWVKKLS